MAADDAIGTRPVLFFHDRERPVAEAPDEDAIAVVNWLSGRRCVDREELGRIRQLAAWLHDRRWWLACGCQSDPRRPPLVVPLHRLGRYFVSRWPGTAHHQSCPLADSHETTNAHPQRRPVGPWNGGWRLLGRTEERSSSTTRRPQSANVRRPEPSTSRIQAVLLSALSRAGYTRLRPADIICRPHRTAVHAHNPYAALRTLAREAVAGGVTFGDIACTYLPSLIAHLDALPAVAQRFPVGVRSLGVFLGVVDDIDTMGERDHQLVWRSSTRGTATVRITVPIHQPAGRTAPGPFWVLLLLGPAPEPDGRFVAVQACAHPALSRRVLLPVTSAAERDTAELLLRQITYWAKPASRLAVNVDLEKPVVDEQIPAGPARPDFALWLPNSQRLIVQTVTAERTRSDCQQHRRQLHQLPGVAAVVEHHPDRDEPHRFARKLTALLHVAVERSAPVESSRTYAEPRL
ncbi:MAG: hypothetical protein ACRD29_00170 [Acidimicrobiales bacterium]